MPGNPGNDVGKFPIPGNENTGPGMETLVSRIKNQSVVILVSCINLANPGISRNLCLAICIFFRFQIVGLAAHQYHVTTAINN